MSEIISCSEEDPQLIPGDCWILPIAVGKLAIIDFLRRSALYFAACDSSLPVPVTSLLLSGGERLSVAGSTKSPWIRLLSRQ
jgi:hypothetical protein